MGCRAQTRPAASGAAPRAAVAAYLAALEHPESAATRRVYGYTLRALADRFGADTALGAFDEPAGAAAVSGWFEQCWETAPSPGVVSDDSQVDDTGALQRRSRCVRFVLTLSAGHRHEGGDADQPRS